MKPPKPQSTASDWLGCLGLLLAWIALAWLVGDMAARWAGLSLWPLVCRHTMNGHY